MGYSDDIPDDAGFWWKLVHLNPTLWRGLIIAVVSLLAAVGITVASGLQDATFAFIVAVVAVVQALWTKPAVTANKKVVVYKPDPVESPNVLASGEAMSQDVDAVAGVAGSSPGTLVVAQN